MIVADLKPENILFKSKAEDAEMMLADFGVRPPLHILVYPRLTGAVVKDVGRG